ncbi:uncharacterized protein I206_106743 [Kwoniella pini CBS 10737]|uniref:Uncharacterized protein n=1 Tax=Kwoniella pini CBS 10737 TaxID=1296096 RepID=A0A1B9HTC0_9TREE|nr:uncharacterized protein I206_07369 [Kwoniella pini CBS 10737]OCF46516.1 hypothetical protein I206_07369 [Kwoniella pini CBS 10737]
MSYSSRSPSAVSCQYSGSWCTHDHCVQIATSASFPPPGTYAPATFFSGQPMFTEPGNIAQPGNIHAYPSPGFPPSRGPGMYSMRSSGPGMEVPSGHTDSGYDEHFPSHQSARRGSNYGVPPPPSPTQTRSHRVHRPRNDSAYYSGSAGVDDVTERLAQMTARRGSTAKEQTGQPKRQLEIITGENDPKNNDQYHEVFWRLPAKYFSKKSNDPDSNCLVAFHITKNFDGTNDGQSHWKTLCGTFENRLKDLSLAKVGKEIPNEEFPRLVDEVESYHARWWQSRIIEPRRARELNPESADKFIEGSRLFDYGKTTPVIYNKDTEDEIRRLAYRQIFHPYDIPSDGIIADKNDSATATVSLTYDESDVKWLKQKETVEIPFKEGWHKYDNETIQSKIATLFILDFERQYLTKADENSIRGHAVNLVKNSRAELAAESASHERGRSHKPKK